MAACGMQGQASVWGYMPWLDPVRGARLAHHITLADLLHAGSNLQTSLAPLIQIIGLERLSSTDLEEGCMFPKTGHLQDANLIYVVPHKRSSI